MSEDIAFNDPVWLYIEYLKRSIRTSNMSLRQAHQLMISRLVAQEIGVTEEQIKQLNEDLEDD